jgi:hypothetical protein
MSINYKKIRPSPECKLVVINLQFIQSLSDFSVALGNQYFFDGLKGMEQVYTIESILYTKRTILYTMIL